MCRTAEQKRRANDNTAGAIQNAALDGNRTGRTTFNGSGRKRCPQHRQRTSQIFYGRPSQCEKTEPCLAAHEGMIVKAPATFRLCSNWLPAPRLSACRPRLDRLPERYRRRSISKNEPGPNSGAAFVARSDCQMGRRRSSWATAPVSLIPTSVRSRDIVLLRRLQAGRVEPAVHMGRRFGLPRLSQGRVAEQAMRQQLRLVAQILRFFEEALCW